MPFNGGWSATKSASGLATTMLKYNQEGMILKMIFIKDNSPCAVYCDHTCS
jgi:hypothetical protein